MLNPKRVKLNNFYSFSIIHLLFIVCATILFFPILSNEHIPSTNASDYLNHFAAIMQAKIALTQGHFPLRIAPFEQNGLQYPYFQFYSPTSYLIAGFIYHWLPFQNPFFAYKFTLWLGLLCGSHYMFRIVYVLSNSRIAAGLAGIIFITMPYLIVLIDHFGSFNEALAVTLLPMVLYYCLQRYQYPKENKGILLASFAWALLATVHTITFLYASLFVLLFFFLHTLIQYKLFKNLIAVFISYFFGVMLAMWFLAPLILYAKYLVIYHTFSSMITYLLSPSLFSLLTPIPVRNALIHVGSTKFYFDILPAISWPALITVCLSLSMFLKKPSQILRLWIITLLVLFCLLLILIHSPINIWRWLPHQFLIIQYPWRLLGQTAWISSILFGIAIYLQLQQSMFKLIMFITVLICVCFFAWLAIPEKIKFNINDFQKNPVLIEKFDSYLINPKLTNLNKIHQLPVSDKLPSDGFLSPHDTLFLNEVRPFCKSVIGKIDCIIDVKKGIELLELPVLFYPDLLKITLNNKLIAYQTILYGKNVIIGVKPDIGVNRIIVDFQGLVWANCISQVAWMLWFIFLGFFILENKFKKSFQTIL